MKRPFSWKNTLNGLLAGLTGHQITRLDKAGYRYRDELYTFVDSCAPHGKILDTGSAHGSYAKDHYKDVITIDVSPPADVIDSISNMPFPTDSFDTVICLETLEHVKDPFGAMAEIHRVLKSKGLVIASAPFAYELHGEEYGDYWRFTRQGWELLLKDFHDISIKSYAGTTTMPGWYMVRAIK